MKIEAGKRYVRRDGEISGGIDAIVSASHPFSDNRAGWTYNVGGAFNVDTNRPSKLDLISEYIEEPPLSDDDAQRHAIATDFIRLPTRYQRCGPMAGC